MMVEVESALMHEREGKREEIIDGRLVIFNTSIIAASNEKPRIM